MIAAGAGWLLFHKQEHSIILITLDTTRVDYVSCYGVQQNTTPFIDSIARNGVLFENAFTPVPMTLPSHSTIMTGLYPMHHGVHGNGTYRLSSQVMTLAKLFKSHEYATAAVVASYILNSRFGLAEGFDAYHDQMNLQSDLPSENAQITADEVTRRSIQALKGMNGRKFFMWIHYFDPHTPYNPPLAYINRFSNPYAGEIAYMDDQISVLMGEFKNEPWFDDAVIIIAGDHGESLGEHEEEGHGYFLYNTTLKVPYIIKFPSSPGFTGKISQEVTTLDIFPTLCDYLDFDCQSYHLEGKSLLPLLKEKTKDAFHDSIYAETRMPEIDFGWDPLLAVMKNGWKYIQAPQPELYHYSENNDERDNIFAANQQKAQRFATSLAVWQDNERKKEIDASIKIDSESLEKLHALGYLGSSLPRDGNAAHVDVKDMKTTLRVLNESNVLLNTGRFSEAVTMVENEIARLESINKPAAFLYSIAAQYYASKGDYDKAIGYYKKYLSLSPNYTDYYITLAKIYGDFKQDYPTAIDYLNTALQLDSKIVESYTLLGNYLVNMQKYDEAEGVFKKGIAYFPDDYNLLNGYARLLSFSNRNDEALVIIQHAIELAPGIPDAYINCAIIYFNKHDMTAAREKIQKALQINPNHSLALEIQQKLLGVNQP